MRKRVYGGLVAALIVVLFAILANTQVASADDTQKLDSALQKTHTVGFVYVTTYQNRLANSHATVIQMQKFFDSVQWKPDYQYSFLRDVVHNNFTPDDGYVQTPLGFAYGSCGASSLLNKLAKTTMFRDTDGLLKPVFQTVVVHTWTGDKTYGKWGATIFLDPTGKKTEDFVWKLNPDYDGIPPKLTTNFDMVGETVSITMQYSDEMAAPATPEPTPKLKSAATSAATPPAEPSTQPTAQATSQAIANTSAMSKGIADVSYLVQQATSVPTAKPTRGSIEPVSAGGDSGPAIVKLSPDSTARELTQELTALIKESRFGVSVIPIGDAALTISEAGVNQDTQAFVASAFKGPVAIYFFENIDPSVWKDVPVKYWLAKSDKELPAELRDTWQANKDILKDLYQAAIFSDNDSTGNLLAYVYNHAAVRPKGSNPIVAFNNWLHDSAGLTEASGLKSWVWGATNNATSVDDRYGKWAFGYRGKILIPTNSFSPHDLALVYVHLATKGRELGYYDKAVELLSTIATPTHQSFIQIYLRRRGIQTASKDGLILPDSADSDGFYISTDAGLLTLPDGSQFAVAFMALDSGNLLDDAVTMVGKSLVPDPRVAVSIGTSGQ